MAIDFSSSRYVFRQNGEVHARHFTMPGVGCPKVSLLVGMCGQVEVSSSRAVDLLGVSWEDLGTAQLSDSTLKGLREMIRRKIKVNRWKCALTVTCASMQS